MFTRPAVLSERFASSAALQYYEFLPTLKDLVTYVQQKICYAANEPCKAKAATLRFADYLDIDYDAISQTFILSAFRHAPPEGGLWDEHIDNAESSAKIEVGVLASEKATQPEEVSLGGFLTVIGEDKKPSMSPGPLPLSSPLLIYVLRSHPFFFSIAPPSHLFAM